MRITGRIAGTDTFNPTQTIALTGRVLFTVRAL